MKDNKTSTRTPKTPKLTKQAFASSKSISRSENNIESPEVHPYLADILSRAKPEKASIYTLMEEHLREKPGES
jgi:hypothetical protein